MSCCVCGQIKTKLGKRSFSFSSSPIPIFQLLASCPFILELCYISVIKYCECSWCMQNSQLLILFLKEWQLVVMWAATWKQYNVQSVEFLNVVYLMWTSFVSHCVFFSVALRVFLAFVQIGYKYCIFLSNGCRLTRFPCLGASATVISPFFVTGICTE